jgi:hypothetical protein
MGLSRAQKLLLAWGICFILVAEVVKHLDVSQKAATLIGLVEVALAIVTGIAFGVAQTARTGD